MSSIRFEEVGHQFGERVVLSDVSADLREARVGIIGSNGSGKSTLARMINGLVHPTSGRVIIDDLEPARHGAEVRRKVSFLFSDPDAQIVMPTVGEDIAFSLRRLSLGKTEVAARVESALELVGLPGYADHPAHHLSSGQKQLLAMASILVTEPSILVCDEPTTLLDMRNTRRLAELLNGLSQQIILVTHDLDLIVGYERVLVIADGRLVADGHGAESVAYYRKLMS